MDSATIIAEALIFGIGAVLWFVSLWLHYKLFSKWLLQKKFGKVFVYMLFTVFFGWFFGSGFIAVAIAASKTVRIAKNKIEDRNKIYERLSKNATVEDVDLLIDFIKEFGCINTPNEWNQLRAVWFAVNESPNIPTEKKNEFKKFLMLKGLTMHHQDSQVIDNYAKA